MIETPGTSLHDEEFWTTLRDGEAVELVRRSHFDEVARQLANTTAALAARDRELGPLRGLLILAGDLREAWAEVDDAQLDDYGAGARSRAARGHLDGVRIALESHLSTIDDAADRAAIDAALADPANADGPVPWDQIRDELDLLRDAATDPAAAAHLVHTIEDGEPTEFHNVLCGVVTDDAGCDELEGCPEQEVDR